MSIPQIIDTFALSPMQQGMLFQHLKESHSGVDIEQLVVHLHESVDAVALRWLGNGWSRRHDVLRAVCWEGMPNPQQDILGAVAAVWCGGRPPMFSTNDQSERLRSVSQDRTVSLGFDLNCAPIFRLLSSSGKTQIILLVWTFHHSLLDGRCYPDSFT